ncbi:MAG: glycosyltransferase family 4 protein [Actinobacteria bacterium]|nr:glycosyltransferase family 4 protein [Actinomycetota bacterium]
MQEQVLGMSRELMSRGIETLVVSPEGGAPTSETPARLVRLGGCVSIPANGSKAPITLSPVAAQRARRAIENFDAEVIFFHEPFAPLVGYGALLGTSSAIRVGTFHRSGGGPAYRFTKPLLRQVIRRLDALVAVSDRAAVTLRNATGVEAEVLFSGFEMNRFAPRERPSVPTILFVGRFETRKGAHVVIEAVKSWREVGGPEVHLIMAGDGPDGANLRRLADGDSAISFVGAISDAEKRHLLGESAVVVAASLFGESFGMTLLEGMASGAAVVASDIDGYREAAGGFATLFEPNDPTDLRRAISTALAQTDTQRHEARRHAEGWSMQALVDHYLRIYDRCQARR